MAMLSTRAMPRPRLAVPAKTALPHTGMAFQVVSAPLVAPIRLQDRQAPVGARLCGGTSTCIALVRLDPEPA